MESRGAIQLNTHKKRRLMDENCKEHTQKISFYPYIPEAGPESSVVIDRVKSMGITLRRERVLTQKCSPTQANLVH